MRPAVSVITLGVADLEASIAFYRDVLGWPTGAKPEDGVAFFQLNGIVLSLFGADALAEDAGVVPGGAAFRGVALAQNLDSIEEVDRVFAELRSKNVTVTKAPAKTFWGGYSGYFADPDGHLWEVAWNPFWTLRDDGGVELPDGKNGSQA